MIISVWGRLTLDVVRNLYGDAVDIPALGAELRVTLRVALALRVALDVTRLAAISLLTPRSRRPRSSDDGATNTVTLKDKVHRRNPPSAHASLNLSAWGR